jgi:hypothetical protein
MSFLIWLQESPFGLWVAESIWAYPIILTLHTVGFGVLVGTSAFLDLRLLGVGAGVPLAPLEILSYARWIGLTINVLTGVALFVAAATEKGMQTIFYVKLSLIVLALLTDRGIRRRVFGDRGALATTTPFRARRLAAVSLVLWAGAVTAGRLMAYV